MIPNCKVYLLEMRLYPWHKVPRSVFTKWSNRKDLIEDNMHLQQTYNVTHGRKSYTYVGQDIDFGSELLGLDIDDYMMDDKDWVGYYDSQDNIN